MTREDNSDLEAELANIAFSHGRTFNSNTREAMVVIRDQMDIRKGVPFDLQRLDT